MELGRVQHGPGGREAGEVRGGWSQEHVVDEQGVPRVRRDEPDAQAVLRVRAGEQVPQEQLLPGEVRETDVLSRA